MKEFYRTEDGREFSNKAAASAWESCAMPTILELQKILPDVPSTTIEQIVLAMHNSNKIYFSFSPIPNQDRAL